MQQLRDIGRIPVSGIVCINNSFTTKHLQHTLSILSHFISSVIFKSLKNHPHFTNEEWRFRDWITCLRSGYSKYRSSGRLPKKPSQDIFKNPSLWRHHFHRILSSNTVSCLKTLSCTNVTSKPQFSHKRKILLFTSQDYCED